MVLTWSSYRHVHTQDLSKGNVSSVDDASSYWRSVYLATIDNSNGRPKYLHQRHPITRKNITKQDVVCVEDLDIVMTKITFDKAPKKVKQTIRVKGRASSMRVCCPKVS